MADIGALVMRIQMDGSQLERAFNQLGGSARQFQQGLNSLSGMLQTAFLAATSAAVAMTIQAGKTAEEIEQLAQKTGISADSLEGMTVVMSRNGLTAQSMAMAVKGLSQQMVGVQHNTASSIKLFTDMGVSLEVVNKGVGATIRAIADRFKEMPDGANKAKLAVELFGRAGLEWIPILNKGGAALDESMKKSAEFGLVLTETARSQLTTFDDAMDDLTLALKGFGMQVGVAFAPTLTALVTAMTDAVVVGKNIFNGFADAAATLSIRLAGVVASAQILSSVLFSTNALSKAAWQEALNHVQAIDQWAAAEIAAVKVAREAEKGLDALAIKHLDTAKSVETHTHNQKALGEMIVSTTKIALNQAKEMSTRIFTEIFNEEEALSKASFLQGPEPGGETGQQRMLREEAILAQANFDVQKAFYDQAPGLIGAANAAREKGLALIEAQSELEAFAIRDSLELESTKSAQLVALDADTQAKRMALAKQFPTFWEQQLQAVVASNAFSVGLIVNTWTSGIANSIVRGGDFVKAAWESTQIAIVQGAINTGLQLAAQWALQQTTELTIMKTTLAAKLGSWTTFETTKSTISAAAEAERTLASVTASKLIASTSVAAVVAAGQAMLAVMNGVVIAIAGVFAAMGAGLAATIIGAPFAVPFEVAAGAVIVAGTAALVAASALVAAASSAAVGAALAFSDGGIGDFGSGTPATLHGPEAIIPLNQRGAAFMQELLGGMGGTGSGKVEQTIVLDGRVLARSVADHLPSSWRIGGLPA